jgi:hypothetical protein
MREALEQREIDRATFEAIGYLDNCRLEPLKPVSVVRIVAIDAGPHPVWKDLTTDVPY